MTPEQIKEIFEQEETIKQANNDIDFDGLSDDEEPNIQLSDRIIATDYSNPDTDGDGLYDGPYNYYAINNGEFDRNEKGFGELSKIISNSNVENQMFYRSGDKIPLSISSFRRMYADPNKVDSDNDQLSDLDEFKWGTDPFNPDSDFDGLTDAAELILELDPTNADTDGDSHLDGFEYDRQFNGFDPHTYTKLYTKSEYLSEFSKGLIAGDWIEIDTIPEISGSIASGLVVVGDIRDFLANSVDGDYVGAAINVLGIVPAIGDYAKSVALIAKVAKKSKSPGRIIKLQLKATPLDNKWTKELAQQIFGDSFTYVSSKIPEKALLPMIRNGQDFHQLSKAIKAAENSAGVSKIKSINNLSRDGFIFSTGNFKHWQNGERYLAKYISGSTTLSRKTLKADIPSCIGKHKNCQNRFLDYYDVATNIGYEAKTGYVKNTPRIKTQIKKDCYNLNNSLMDRLDDMVWHFMPSEVSMSVGFDESLIDLMKCGGKKGIKYKIHLP